MDYELRLLGPFQLVAPGGAEVAVASKKVQALIAMLALAEDVGVTRLRLMSILWARSGDEQARNSLRQGLTALRKAFAAHGDFPFRITEDKAAVDGARLASDVQRFQALVGSNEASEMEEAVGLWRGESLEGFATVGEAAEEWLEGERRRLHALYVEALSRVMTRHVDAGDHGGALHWAHRLIAADAVNEPAQRAVMRSYAMAGERAKALKQYQICRDMLDRELGARFLVEGSLRRAANRVRITVDLIEAASGMHLWAERYDRELEDIFAVQDEIARLVVTTLVGRLDAAGAGETRRRPPGSLTAYDPLLRGLDHYFRLDKTENRQARELFERAIAADPDYAEAHYRCPS